jgi:hypothetical protein
MASSEKFHDERREVTEDVEMVLVSINWSNLQGIPRTQTPISERALLTHSNSNSCWTNFLPYTACNYTANSLVRCLRLDLCNAHGGMSSSIAEKQRYDVVQQSPARRKLHYPFWFGGSAASMAAVVTHPLDLGT